MNKIVIGNWKMYKMVAEAKSFVEALLPCLNAFEVEPYLAVPYTAIAPLAELAKGSKLKIGAQNMNDATEGAFTGEIAAKMLLDVGASFVLLGHSERRHLFGESESLIRKKIERALRSSLQPILCVGEKKEEKRDLVLREQLFTALEGLQPGSLMIAYEPVWAIGKGVAATPELAEEAHLLIRGYLKELYGSSGEKIPLLYGGSVTEKNCKALAKKPDIDGILVGGASLSFESFKDILEQLSGRL